MRKLQTFTVLFQKSEARVTAHFLTMNIHDYQVKFWIKARWWNRRRCVATFDWRYVIGVRNEAQAADAEFLKSLHVSV